MSSDGSALGYGLIRSADPHATFRHARHRAHLKLVVHVNSKLGREERLAVEQKSAQLREERHQTAAGRAARARDEGQGGIREATGETLVRWRSDTARRLPEPGYTSQLPQAPNAGAAADSGFAQSAPRSLGRATTASKASSDARGTTVTRQTGGHALMGLTCILTRRGARRAGWFGPLPIWRERCRACQTRRRRTQRVHSRSAYAKVLNCVSESQESGPPARVMSAPRHAQASSLTPAAPSGAPAPPASPASQPLRAGRIPQGVPISRLRPSGTQVSRSAQRSLRERTRAASCSPFVYHYVRACIAGNRSNWKSHADFGLVPRKETSG